MKISIIVGVESSTILIAIVQSLQMLQYPLSSISFKVETIGWGQWLRETNFMQYFNTNCSTKCLQSSSSLLSLQDDDRMTHTESEVLIRYTIKYLCMASSSEPTFLIRNEYAFLQTIEICLLFPYQYYDRTTQTFLGRILLSYSNRCLHRDGLLCCFISTWYRVQYCIVIVAYVLITIN